MSHSTLAKSLEDRARSLEQQAFHIDQMGGSAVAAADLRRDARNLRIRASSMASQRRPGVRSSRPR